MVNLEWYRTFKSVYKNGNFSLAAKELFISQPAVSQQISMLEAHVGYKLFIRKSKGVEATQYAKLLNNLIIEALERLENVENGFREKAFITNKLITIGISHHFFQSIGRLLMDKFDYINFSFYENEMLFELVNNKKIDFAIVTQKYDTFDTLQEKIGQIKPILVASPNLIISKTSQNLQTKQYVLAQKWLNAQKWFSNDAGIISIKHFWLYAFAKKRPTIVANYIIPSENDMLETLSQSTGLAVAWNCAAKKYIEKQQLQLLWDSPQMPETKLYLLSRKIGNGSTAFAQVAQQLQQSLCY